MDLEQPALSAASHIGRPGMIARQRPCQGWGHPGPQAKGTHASKGIWQEQSVKRQTEHDE